MPVDAQAASIRETLATLYLSILPAGVGCIAGAVSILVMGGVPELGIFCGFVALYLAGSMPLIARHQKFQGDSLTAQCAVSAPWKHAPPVA